MLHPACLCYLVASAESRVHKPGFLQMWIYSSSFVLDTICILSCSSFSSCLVRKTKMVYHHLGNFRKIKLSRCFTCLPQNWTQKIDNGRNFGHPMPHGLILCVSRYVHFLFRATCRQIMRIAYKSKTCGYFINKYSILSCPSTIGHPQKPNSGTELIS